MKSVLTRIIIYSVLVTFLGFVFYMLTDYLLRVFYPGGGRSQIEKHQENIDQILEFTKPH